MKNQKPLVFITAGDPLGIGPEVTVKALQDKHVQKTCTPIVIGEPTTLYQAGFSADLAALIPIESSKILIIL